MGSTERQSGGPPAPWSTEIERPCLRQRGVVQYRNPSSTEDAFEVYLTPVTHEQGCHLEPGRRMASSPISSARPVVLVVDDEPVALAVLQRTLEPHYHVLTASDGLEALNIIEAWGPSVRVVVTDVRMPGLSGPALAAHLARLNRSPAILFVSGFTDPDVPGEVLAKPFQPDALLSAVSRLLESQERSGSGPD